MSGRQMTLFAGESDDDNASMRRGRRFRACGDYGEARPVRHASAAAMLDRAGARKGRMTREVNKPIWPLTIAGEARGGREKEVLVGVERQPWETEGGRRDRIGRRPGLAATVGGMGGRVVDAGESSGVSAG